MNYYTVTVKHEEGYLLCRLYVWAESRADAIEKAKEGFQQANYFAIAEGKG